MAGLQIDTWYLSMPPITRAFMTACVATSVFEFLGVVGIMDLYLNFTLVTERYEVRGLIFSYTWPRSNQLPLVQAVEIEFPKTDTFVVCLSQLWRLVTAFVYMGQLGLPFILKMYFAYVQHPHKA